MSKEFEGRIALVTGCASPRGLGRSIANKIASFGASVVILDLNQEAVDQAAKEVADAHGVKTLGIACDITKSDECDKSIDKVKEVFGKLDFLVNNAGVVKDNILMRMSEKDWDLVLDVNLKGAFLMTKAATRLILKSPMGRIVNISSISGLLGQAGQANYAASKAGLIALTQTSAREFAGRNITVNAVCPGYVATDLTSPLPPEIIEKLKTLPVLKRQAIPEDVANVVKFYLSTDASYVTGTYLRVDGGAAIGA